MKSFSKEIFNFLKLNKEPDLSRRITGFRLLDDFTEKIYFIKNHPELESSYNQEVLVVIETPLEFQYEWINEEKFKEEFLPYFLKERNKQ